MQGCGEGEDCGGIVREFSIFYTPLFNSNDSGHVNLCLAAKSEFVII